MLIYTYGGSYDGKGAYITGAEVVPTDVNVAWGYNLGASMKVKSIFNQGSRENPVAAAILEARVVVGVVDDDVAAATAAATAPTSASASSAASCASIRLRAWSGSRISADPAAPEPARSPLNPASRSRLGNAFTHWVQLTASSRVPVPGD